MESNDPMIAIIGAGPIGLDAALAADQRGLRFRLFESSKSAGGHVRAWGHVRLFTPWEMNVSPRARAALESAGAEVPDGDGCPTGTEFAERLLKPLADLPQLAPHIEYSSRVLEVARDSLLKHDEIGTPGRASRPFRLLIQGRDGRERVEYADIVLDCSGTYGTPNAMGAGGIHAPGERELTELVIRRIPDVELPDLRGEAPGWGGQRILLVGAGHSAQTAARDLAGLVDRVPETKVVWAIRNPDPDFGAVANDPLPERAGLVATARAIAAGERGSFDMRFGVVVDALESADDGILVTLRSGDGVTDTVLVDRIISLTGSVGDARMYRQLQVHECWATAGPMRLSAALLSSSSADCLTETSHGPETLKNPEPNFYILGEKSYGRNTNFLMRIGWEQVDDVFSMIEASPVPTAVAP